jgi:hypothetical protein
MVIKTVTWKPDTCGCVLELSYDTETSLETRTYGNHALHRTCGSHKREGLTNVNVFDMCFEENRRKNNAIGEINKIKSTVEIEGWDWEDEAPNRRLVLHTKDTKGFTKSNLKKMQTALDKRFGKNKVVVD